MSAADQMDSVTGEPVEVIHVDSAVAWATKQDAAMLDVQVSTAKQYPRSVQRFQSDLAAWATLNKETALECFFSMPRDGKNVIGPSIRFAELIQAAYGNLIVESQIVDEGHSFVVVSATCRDLERNIASRAQVRRNIMTSAKQGRPAKRYGDAMIETTIMAASAIARRNAIFQIVPKALWSPIWEKAREVARGDSKTFAERRGAALKALAELGADPKNIKAFLGGKEAKDMTADDLLLLEMKWRAIHNGEATAQEAFPDPIPDTPEDGRSAQRATDALRNAKPAEPKAPKAPADDVDKAFGIEN